MSDLLTDEIRALIADPGSVKVLTTLDGDAAPYAAITDFLQPGDGDTVLYLEALESAPSNKNLVRAIWFEQRIAIALAGRDGRRLQLRGRVERTLIAGPLFQQHYIAFRERQGDVDLAAVWVLRIDAVEDQDFERARQAEEQTHFFFRHLDRYAVQ